MASVGGMLAAADLKHPLEARPWNIHVRATAGEVVRGDVACLHIRHGALLAGDVSAR